MLMIRLSRRGARKQPHYRIVVIEKDRARDGRSVEVVGTYNPRTNPASVELKRDRIDYWTIEGRAVVGPRQEAGGQSSSRCQHAGTDRGAPSGEGRTTGAVRTMSSAVNMVALVEHLAKALVNAPDEVEVEAFEEGGQTVLELFVAEDDLGRIIGRQGRMARSLRTIVNAAALRTRKRYQLEIVE